MLIVLHAIPGFLFALLLVVLFAGGSYFKWFPLRGLVSDDWSTLGLIDKGLDYAWHMALPIGAMVIGGFTTLTFRTTPQVFVTIANGRKVELRLKGTSSVVEKRLARASIGEFKSYLLKYFQAPPTPPDAPATKTAQRG